MATITVLGHEVRVDANVPPGEVWFCRPLGRELRLSAEWPNPTIQIVETARVVGKIVGLST